MKGSAKVECTYSQSNCFSVTSWPLSSDSSPGNVKVLAVETEAGKTHYLSVVSSVSRPGGSSKDSPNVIKINGKLGKALKINHGDRVLFWEVRDGISNNVTTAEVSCCSKDDWEILEANATFVSNHLLDQLRVVYPGQEFPFWISKSMAIHLKIDKITPALEYGILYENSEIIIPSLSSTKCMIPMKLQKHQKFRLHPFFIPSSINLLPSEALLFTNKYHGFVYKSYFRMKIPTNQNSIFVKLIPCHETIKDSMEPTTLKLYFLESVDNQHVKELFPRTSIPSVYLHLEFLQSKKLEVQNWVWISAIPENQLSSMPHHCPVSRSSTENLPNTWDFCGSTQTLNACVDFIKSSLFLCEESLGDNLPCSEFGCLLIHGGPGSGKSFLVDVISTSLSQKPYYVYYEYVSCAKLRGKKPESVEKILSKSLHLLEERQPSILVLDDFDVLAAAPKAEQSPQEEFLHYKANDTILELLMKLQNQRISVICTAVTIETLNEFWKSRPGFHFFQKFIKIPSPTKRERWEIFNASLKRYLNNSGSEDLSCAKQTVIKASTNLGNQIAHKKEKRKDTLQHNADKGTGAMQYDTSCHTDLCSTLGRDDEVTKEIAAALGAIHDQNATPQFLVNVAKKWGTYLESHRDYNPTIKRAGGGHVSSSGVGDAAHGENNIRANEDVNEQINAFNEILREEIRFSGDLSELSKRKHQIQHSMGEKISWEFIGGLTAVKQELKKILEWPIKFPQFFKNAPIKLPSGILFYGYPGSGKTLMGLAIQDIVNVKFIHIKGPELLSKYIGASEQAVQNVFSRARESRPCILFFDEFDSLVPRRGHDSSGVTDRVVNQFLSEMDGIDGGLGDGVYLVAATSRPDLIDPAVLRPGRLDKHLFFDLPSEPERREILSVISSQVSMKVEDESDWNDICRLTEGFTGADLNALMFAAQLAVVHSHLSKLDNDGDKEVGRSTSSNQMAAAEAPRTQDIQVTIQSLLSALKDFKQSIQGQELRKFQAIYREFAVSKSGKIDGAKELFSGSGTMLEDNTSQYVTTMQTGKRATLA